MPSPCSEHDSADVPASAGPAPAGRKSIAGRRKPPEGAIDTVVSPEVGDSDLGAQIKWHAIAHPTDREQPIFSGVRSSPGLHTDSRLAAPAAATGRSSAIHAASTPVDEHVPADPPRHPHFSGVIRTAAGRASQTEHWAYTLSSI